MENVKILANNKKAFYDYFLSDFIEAGLALKGTEIKSLRAHGASLADSYVIIKHNEAFILGMNIAPYEKGNLFNHEALRTKKLLLHRREIDKLSRKIKEKGFTLVVTKVYLKNGLAKCELALAKGKKIYDKRETEKNKSIKREIEKNVKR